MSTRQPLQVSYVSIYMRVGLCLLFICLSQAAPINVGTANYDNNRTNWNPSETILTPSNVAAGGFGKLYTLPVDGVVYAQPLYVSALKMPRISARNVLFVATMHNSVYAFDADGEGTSLWRTNLGPSVPSSDYSYPNYTFTDIIPEVGILSTPVIDLTSQTLYVVASTLRAGVHAYELHALDLASGKEKNGAPVTIQASVPGIGAGSDGTNVAFNAFLHLQRPALLLSGGKVYIAFGSHGDIGDYHGWLLAYDAATMKLAWAFNATPQGQGSAIWQSGRGVACGPDGSIFVVTGNGAFDSISDWGESVVRLDPATGKIVDWFTPQDWSALNDEDLDFGSAGLILVPGTNFALAGGKEGNLYVLDRNQLGHLQSDDHQAVQKFRFVRHDVATVIRNARPHLIQGFQAIGFGIHNFAYWSSSAGSFLYMRANNDVLMAFQMNADGTFQTQPVDSAVVGQGLPFDGLTISSNGADAGSGIVWQTAADSFNVTGPGVLHAYLASDISQELWNSSVMPLRDGYGGFTKFSNPTVANGKVYVGTSSNQIAVYGLLPQLTPGTIRAVVNGASGKAGPVAPGEIIGIFGDLIGPPATNNTPFDGAANPSTSVDGTQVLINGQPAAMIYATPNEIHAIVPDDISSAGIASIQVSSGGTVTAPYQATVTQVVPAVFTGDGSGAGQCSCLNQDGSVNGPSNPASQGGTVVLYGTGAGLLVSTSQNGAAPLSNAQPLLPVSVTIGGVPAKVVSATAAPGMFGAIQVTVVLPADAASNLAAPVVLTVGGVPGPSTTLAIQ